MEVITNAVAAAQQWLFETAVQPLMFALGLGNLLEDGFTATLWLMLGLFQIVVLFAVIGPLQRWRPVDAITDRATIRTDMLYTVIHRLGVFRLVMFFTLEPLLDELVGSARVAGMGTFHLDAMWPGVTDLPWVSLLLYLVVLDFFDYWTHRGQHHFEWWWRLHSLHHAQRQMTMFSDNRNHLLDDLVRDVLVVIVAQLIGVAPGQFVAIVVITQLSESLQHANLRLWFGAVGERLWVSPRFHRLHHSIGLGHESPVKEKVASVGAQFPAGPPQGKLTPSGGSAAHEVASVGATTKRGGHNFGVLLPWWDMLFKTANFEIRYDKTGVRDQVEPFANGLPRDYGRGFWSQQWLGVKRLLGAA